MTEAEPFRLNPNAQVRLRRVGREGQPLLVIDDLFAEPDVLFELACAAAFGEPAAAYYPGLNAPLPRGYIEALMPVLRPSFERAFAIPSGAPMAAMGFFALSTRPLQDLSALQRIPHYDQIQTGALAMVHYLAHGQGGGTGLFRHTATGFESVNSDRRAHYMEAVAAELERDHHLLTGFAGPATPNFELLDVAEFRFNRAVIYPSNVLHCALFDGARLTDDPRSGRLTVNTFYARTDT